MNKRSNIDYWFLPFIQFWGISFSGIFWTLCWASFWDVKYYQMKLIQTQTWGAEMHSHGHNWNTCTASFRKQIPGSKQPSWAKDMVLSNITTQHIMTMTWTSHNCLIFLFWPWQNPENRHLTPEEMWNSQLRNCVSNTFLVANQPLKPKPPQDATCHRNRPRNSIEKLEKIRHTPPRT